MLLLEPFPGWVGGVEDVEVPVDVEVEVLVDVKVDVLVDVEVEPLVDVEPGDVVPPDGATMNAAGIEKGSRPVKIEIGETVDVTVDVDVDVDVGRPPPAGKEGVGNDSSPPPPPRRFMSSTPTSKTPATTPPIVRVRRSRSVRGTGRLPSPSWPSSSPPAPSPDRRSNRWCRDRQ